MTEFGMRTICALILRPMRTVDLNGCAATQRESDGDGINDAFDAFPTDATRMAGF